MNDKLGLSPQVLRKTIKHYLDEHELYHAELAVNMDCGAARDASVLNSYHRNNITHFDISIGEIAKAKENNPDYPYRFVRQDATNLNQYSSSSVDIVYMLHPMAADYSTQAMMYEANRILREDGILFTTVYSRHELPFINRQADRSGFAIQTSEENKTTQYPNYSSRQLDSGTHRFINIARKQHIGKREKIKRLLVPYFVPKLI